jgi:vitamin B12 transporter
MPQVRDTTRTDSTRALLLPPLVVTAAHTPVRSDRIGFALSVIPATELRKRNPATAADALRYVGGTFIDEANGPGGPTIVRLRGGEEVFTQILMDGVQINENGGFFDFLGFTPGNLERIEIARGPQSALYGSSAVSGVVQFLTRPGQAGPVRASLTGEGSAATANGGGYRGHAEISGGSSKVRYSGGTSWTYNRGIYELPNDTKTSDASLRLDASPSDRIGITGSFRFVGLDAMLPVRDPGASRVPLDPNAENERDRVISSVAARYSPSARWQHTLRGTLYSEQFVYADQRDDVAEGQNFPFFVFDATFRLESERLRTAIEYSGSYQPATAGTDLVVSWGLRAERESLSDTTSGEFGSARQEFDRSSRSAFGEILVRPVHWLDLLAGLRAEKYEGLDVSFTPRGSAVIHVSPQFSLRLAAGRAFKAPNLREQYLSNPFIISNPNLEPETSTSVEGGLDASSADRRWNGSITLFSQRYRNLIRQVPAEAGSSQQQNQNLGESSARGVEWMLSFHPHRRWLVGFEGTWLRTRIEDAAGLPPQGFPEGGQLPFRPRTVASAFLDFSPAAQLSLRVRGSHVGSQIVLKERFSGDRVRISAYTLAGLDATWVVMPRWTLFTRFDNLFDTSYQTAFDRRGIPLTGALGVRWQN